MAARLELGVLEVVDGVLGEEANVHGHARHDAAPVGAQEGAVVASLELRELLKPLLHEVGDAAEDLPAALRPEGGPAGEGVAGGGNGGIDLGGTAAGDLAQEGAINRRKVGEGPGRIHALAADPVTWIDADAGDLEHGTPSGRLFGP